MSSSPVPRATLTVYLVDDSALVRRTLTDLLSLVPGVEICGTAANVALAINGLALTRPDVVVLDLNLPGGTGLDVLQAVRIAIPHATVIILTMHSFHDLGARCLEAGADYFFEKARELDPLLDVLGTLARRKNPATAALAVRTEEDLRRQKARSREELFRDVSDSSPDGIQILDLEGRLLWINQLGKLAMEFSPADVARQPSWPDRFQGLHRKNALTALATARESGLARFTAPCATMKGRVKWWEIAVTRILDDAGHPAKFLVISRDVTNRKSELEKISSQLDELESEKSARDAGAAPRVRSTDVLPERPLPPVDSSRLEP